MDNSYKLKAFPYDNIRFKNKLEYYLYEICVYCINNRDKKYKEISEFVYEYFQEHDLQNALGQKLVFDRIRYLVRAIIDCCKNITNLSAVSCPVHENSCSGRHYMLGVSIVKTVVRHLKETQIVYGQEENAPEPSDIVVNNFNDIDKSIIIKSFDLRAKNAEKQVKMKDKTMAQYVNYHQQLMEMYKNNSHLKPFHPIAYESRHDRTLIVPLADMHYGLKAYDEDNNVIYSPQIANERLERYAHEVVEFAREHSAQTIVVCLLGDLVHGDIHRNCCGELEDGFDSPTVQLHWLDEALERFFEFLAHNVVEVRYYTVSGNHDRIHTSKDQNTQYHNYTCMMLDALRGTLSPLPNINFCNRGQNQTFFHGKLDRQFFQVYDYNIEIAHGDGEGNTMRSAMSANARHNTPVDYRLIGHYHTEGNSKFGLTNTFTMGSFCSPDIFSQKFGGYEASQTILMFDRNKKGYVSQKIIF